MIRRVDLVALAVWLLGWGVGANLPLGGEGGSHLGVGADQALTGWLQEGSGCWHVISHNAGVVSLLFAGGLSGGVITVATAFLNAMAMARSVRWALQALGWRPVLHYLLPYLMLEAIGFVYGTVAGLRLTSHLLTMLTGSVGATFDVRTWGVQALRPFIMGLCLVGIAGVLEVCTR